MAEANDPPLEVPAEDLDLGRPAELEYAGFWSRVAALIVDNTVITIFGLALLIAASALGAGAVVIANLVYILIAILYWPLLESSERQATLGKQLMGIQVVDANGARLSFVRALLRNLAKIISSLPFGLGFLLAAFTPKKQALHDMITKCLVVRAGPSNFRKAAIATVGALVITIAGGYYYFTEVYLPQMAEDLGRQMEKGMKQAQKGVAPAKTAPAPGTPRVMTPEELAAFEKQMAEARREPAKVAAAPPAAPAAEVKPAPAKPVPAPAAKEAAPKPAAAPPVAAKPEPKPEMKPVAVAATKPKPKPAAEAVEMPKPPAPVAPTPLVSEPPSAPPAESPAPVAPRAPAAPAAVAVPPLTGVVRSPRFNDIMTAVMFRDPKAVSELLEFGWWVDRPDSNGVTPLMAAAWNGDVAMTQILLKAGADPNRHARGGSVLDYAGRGADAQVIELLRRSGAR